MVNILKNEYRIAKKEFRSLDSKTIIIFISSITILTISWYFSNPKTFHQLLLHNNNIDIIMIDLYSYCSWFFFDMILFLVIPFIMIKLLFKEELNGYGLIFGNKKVGFTILLSSAIILIPIIFIVSQSNDFSKYFPLMQSAKEDFTIFLIYELSYIIFIFSWEFIFRGFLLFGLEKTFGLYSIFIQMIPFVILHNGKPFAETFASIFGAIFLGYLALRTRSMLYGFFIHAIILLLLDILAFLK